MYTYKYVCSIYILYRILYIFIISYIYAHIQDKYIRYEDSPSLYIQYIIQTIYTYIYVQLNTNNHTRSFIYDDDLDELNRMKKQVLVHKFTSSPLFIYMYILTIISIRERDWLLCGWMQDEKKMMMMNIQNETK